jgi:hypothetical protein
MRFLLLTTLATVGVFFAASVREWTLRKALFGALAMAAVGGGIGATESPSLALFGAITWGLGGLLVFGRETCS